MKNTDFNGVCTALVTPFLDGKVNYPMLERLLVRQMESGVKAVVLCGTTGEAPTLQETEKLNILKTAKQIVGDNLPLIMGTGSNSTETAIQFSSLAQEAGADALLIVSPYYNKASDSGIIEHYARISNAVQIPIITYNVPSRTGTDISVEVYSILSRIPGIIGVKEATNNIRKILSIRKHCPAHFHIWCGCDNILVPYLACGACGAISVLSNLYPEKVIDLAEAALDGDFDTALDLQLSTQEITDFLFCEGNPVPVKAAMQKIGFDCGNCRLPLSVLSKEHLKELNRLFS